MNYGFQVSCGDVLETIHNNNIHSISEEQAADILTLLNTDKIEQAALKGNDMDEQIDYAYCEIWQQICDKKLLNY
jgi:hypothetical protein